MMVMKKRRKKKINKGKSKDFHTRHFRGQRVRGIETEESRLKMFCNAKII
jgi:hypothetical protein